MRVRVLFLIAWTLCTRTPAVAEDLVTLAGPEATFNEILSGRAKVSGRVLVGLRIGPTTEKFDSQRVRVTLPQMNEKLSLCVRITSNDGRYWALNRYQTQPPSPSDPRLDIPSKYKDELDDYGGGDIIIRVAESGACHEDVEGTIRPVLFGGGDPMAADAMPLQAYVNTGSAKTHLELIAATGRSLGKTRCAKPDRDHAAVSYTHLCELDLPETLASGQYQLLITAKALTGRRNMYRFNIWLPELPE